MSNPAVQRWLFVDGSDEFGGHEVMLLRWLREVARDRRIEASLLAREGSKLQQLAGSMALARALPRHPSARSQAARMVDTFRDAFSFVRTLMRERPDLCVVACGCLLAQPVYAPLARVLGVKVAIYVPIVDSARTMGFPTATWRDGLMRLWYRNVPHAWITITAQQRAHLRDWARVRKPILMLPNTIDPDIEAWARTESEEARAGTRALRVLVLGRLEPQQKGLDLLLAHLERVPLDHMRIHFVGAGWYADWIRTRMAANTRLHDVVELSTWSDARAVLRSHDALLLTSRYEGVPLVMLEAMAAGIPVIASDLPGTRAFLPAECLFDVGNLHDAFAKLARLRDEHHRKAIVARNRNVYWQKASNAMFTVAAQQLIGQLRELAGAMDASSAATSLSASQRK
jgi:glycosyltransferase involved in cell wall biosynthesis